MKNDKIAQLRRFIGGCRPVRLAYIFGSSAKNTGRKPNDVDIGILIKDGLNAEKKLDLCLEIADAAENIYGRKADVVILNSASPFLKYQIARFGKLVYEKDVSIDNEFRFKLMTDYFDAVQLHHFFYSGLKGRRHG